ncbi:MAG TPA: hypothetical protein VLX29_10785 [Nitrospirota bacterium]|nr:hypothetical protein [Nitrospirota bacterium]
MKGDKTGVIKKETIDFVTEAAVQFERLKYWQPVRPDLLLRCVLK